MNNTFIAKYQKNGKNHLVRFDKNKYSEKEASSLLNANDIQNFFFMSEPEPPIQINNDTVLFSGEVGFDITLNTLLPYIKEGKKIALDSAGGFNWDATQIKDMIENFYPDTKIMIMGMCMSATNQILLGAKYENRTATANSKFLIHNASIYIDGDHLQLRKTADMLESETNAITQMYVNVSKKPIEEITYLMQNEKLLNVNTALELNFISKIENNEVEVKEPQNINNKPNNMNEEQTSMLNSLKDSVNGVLNLFKSSSKEVVNLVVQDVNGMELDFGSEITELSQVEVGVSGVTANGEPANGEYTMADVSMYTIENGTVIAITAPTATEDAEEQPDAEVEQLNTEIENLKAEKLAIQNSLTTVKNELETEKEKSVQFESQAKELKNSLDTFKNSFKQEKQESDKPSEVNQEQKSSFSWKSKSNK